MSDIKINSGKLFPIIFHIVLWTVWIGLPIMNAGDNERFRMYSMWMVPVSLMHIPLFLLNTEWLIPRVLPRRGVTQYVIGLVLLIAVFATLHYFLKAWIIPEEIRFRHNQVFWAFVPVFFVTAISTGYGFIIYLVKQEKARQEEQEERLRAELSFLRSQISPHFIFNILNSIVYLIRTKSEQAEPLTLKLSELMRYILYTSEDEQVPLEKELDYLKNYLDLQRIRFEEDVDINVEIDGQIANQRIDSMLLIPFVENAFKHGVGLVRDPVIDINLQFDRQKLFLSVRNKITPEAAGEKDPSSGIGLRNVKRRLELLYPGSHQLEIRERNDWFEVVLKLQFTTGKTKEETAAKSLYNEAPMPGR